MSEQLHIEITLPDEYAGSRLDQALAQICSDYSRGQISKWIKAGYVLVDQQLKRPRDTIYGGEQIIIDATLESVDESWVAQAIELDIVHEDNDILIINKPAGMVVHPGAGNQQGTLVNALLHHAPGLEAIPRAGIVHRIDKGTTGLLMVAKTLKAHNSLVSQLQARTVQREYQAVALGVLTAGGTIDHPIGRHHIERKKMAINASGKPAVTHYRVEQRFRGHTQIRCKLETGRTHQIRVHMAHIRHPLLGDPAYGGRLKMTKGMSEACREAIQTFKRQALHAGVLGFKHPATDTDVSWQVDLPEDMKQLISALALDASQV